MIFYKSNIEGLKEFHILKTRKKNLSVIYFLQIFH